MSLSEAVNFKKTLGLSHNLTTKFRRSNGKSPRAIRT